jgi:hypothetical protein
VRYRDMSREFTIGDHTHPTALATVNVDEPRQLWLHEPDAGGLNEPACHGSGWRLSRTPPYVKVDHVHAARQADEFGDEVTRQSGICLHQDWPIGCQTELEVSPAPSEFKPSRHSLGDFGKGWILRHGLVAHDVANLDEPRKRPKGLLCQGKAVAVHKFGRQLAASHVFLDQNVTTPRAASAQL